jgi:hypothetical protein
LTAEAFETRSSGMDSPIVLKNHVPGASLFTEDDSEFVRAHGEVKALLIKNRIW